MKNLPIVGAGLAGLLAAHAFPGSEIYEASEQPIERHRALLRFRSDAVSRLTGIPFRRVTVRKSIWHEGAHRQPDLQLANFYGQKLFGSGVIGPDRSIWATEPCERYVAPPDFYSQLLAQLQGRIHWAAPFGREQLEAGCISTIPLPTALGLLGQHVKDVTMASSPIAVYRFKLPGADAYQTVYYPDLDFPIYRASITGDTFIVESVAQGASAEHIGEAARAFGIKDIAFGSIERVSQRHGKILPIPDSTRKGLLFSLTHSYGIYSVGRFATWRNILLDDVVKDLEVIKSIRSSESAYAWKRHTAGAAA